MSIKKPKLYQPRILMLDIERAPYLGYLWDQGKQYISEAQIIEDSYVLTWQAKWWKGGWLSGNLWYDGREAMIKRVHDAIEAADVVIGWNSNGFDLKVLNKEFLSLSLGPPAPYKSVDLLTTSRTQFKFLNNKLDYVARKMGCPYGKLPHDKSMWLACMGLGADKDMEKHYGKMLRYNKRDVQLLDWIFPRFRPYIRGFPNLNIYLAEPDGKRRCPRCLHTKLRFFDKRPILELARDRYHCGHCGGWSYWMAQKHVLKPL